MPIVRPYPWRVIPAVDRGLTIACGPIGTRRASRRTSNIEGIPEWPTGRIRATDDARLAGKTITFPRAFYFVRRHCLESESPAAPAPWRGSGATTRPKARKPVRGTKEWHTGAKDGLRVERNQRRAEANRFHRRAIPAKIRMRIRMHFCFRRAEEASMPTGSRAKAGFRWLPYAVPLKGKRPKKVQLPKEAHKVHTASLMSAQPYSSLAFRLWRKSA